MNIHFSDTETLEKLLAASLVKLKVGSHLYNLQDENSDTDYLYIYAPFENEKNSFSFSHHQFQYKNILENADYNFVSLPNFIRNAINGDSTINYECINSQQIEKSVLSFLYEMRHEFNNYMIIRSYCGLARRDIKHMNRSNDIRERNKSLSHIYRGYYFAMSIYENNFSNILPVDQFLKIKSFKDITDDQIRNTYRDNVSEQINLFREQINLDVNKGKITRFMRVEAQKNLDMHLQSLYKTDFYKSKIGKEINMEPIYHANENGVIY